MNLQIKVLEWFQQLRNTPLTVFMTTMTMLAESLFLVSTVAILYWCVDKKKSRRLAFLVLFNSVLNGFIKTIVHMPRPYEVNKEIIPLRLKTGTGSTFPSGHTQSITAFWAGAAVLFKTKAIKVLGVLMVLLVAFSRMYLGMHWPMDVLGGIIFGLLGVGIANEFIDKEGNIDVIHIYLVTVILAVVLGFKVEEDCYKAVSAFWGMLVGLYFEQRYVGFIPCQTIKVQIKKVIIGIIGIVIIALVFTKLLPVIKMLRMLKYILILIWITFGAPYCFKRLGYNNRVK